MPHPAIWVAAGLAMLLSACATPPDLSAIEAKFDASPEERPARVAATVSRSNFGRQVSRAVESSPDLAASSASVRASQARADIEGRSFFPRFSAEAMLGELVNGSLSGGGINPLLRVVQLVYDGGASASRRVAAEARVLESRGARQELAAATTLDTVAAWYDLRAARARLRISQESVRAHERVLRRVRDRAEAGAGGNADVLTTEARLATARARAAEAQARVDRAEAGFVARYGTPPPAQLTDPPQAPRLPQASDDVLIATSPRMLGMEARIAAAEADMSVAQAQRFPQVSATGEAQDGNTRATLDVDYDTGAPGSQRARIAAAEAERDAVLAERARLAREITRALADLRSDRRAGAARVAAAREAVRANRATVDASREEFSIGRRSLIGLLDAERDLLDANETLIAAEQEVALSGYAALALTGDILDAFAIRLPQPTQADTDDTE